MNHFNNLIYGLRKCSSTRLVFLILILFNAYNVYACNSSDLTGINSNLVDSKKTCTESNTEFTAYKCAKKHDVNLDSLLNVAKQCGGHIKVGVIQELLDKYNAIRYYCEAWDLKDKLEVNQVDQVSQIVAYGRNCLYSKPSPSPSPINADAKKNLEDFWYSYTNYIAGKIVILDNMIRVSSNNQASKLRAKKGTLLSYWQQSFYRYHNAASKRNKGVDAAGDILTSGESGLEDWNNFYDEAKIHITCLTKISDPPNKSEMGKQLVVIGRRLNAGCY